MSKKSDYGSDGGFSHDGQSVRSFSDRESDNQSKVMKFALGSNKSNADNGSMFAGLLVVAIIFTLFFVLMNIPSFDRVMAQRIKHYNKRLAVKAFLFLFLVVIIGIMIHLCWNSRCDNSSYDDCDDDRDN